MRKREIELWPFDYISSMAKNCDPRKKKSTNKRERLKIDKKNNFNL